MERVVSHDELVELLGAYALNAVDPDEAVLLAAHLVQCPKCAAEVDEHRSTAALLAYQGSDAPSDLWDRISAQLEPAGPASAPEVGLLRLPPMVGDRLPPGRAGGGSRRVSAHRRAVLAGTGARGRPAERPWLRRTVAAAAAVVIALLAVQVARLDSRVGTLSSAAAHQTMPALAEAALADPQAERVALVSATSAQRTVGDLVILPDGTAFLVEGHMTPLPAGRTYQLWGMAGGQAVSLGLLGRDPSVAAFDLGAAGPVRSFAVTVEPAGGVVMATTPPVAVGTLQRT
jgi:anti-sigma factor RsiW